MRFPSCSHQGNITLRKPQHRWVRVWSKSSSCMRWRKTLLFISVPGHLRHAWAAGLGSWPLLGHVVLSDPQTLVRAMTAQPFLVMSAASCLLLSLGHFPSIIRGNGHMELVSHQLGQLGGSGSCKTPPCYPVTSWGSRTPLLSLPLP